MSELGELDRAGTPDTPGAWDVRSEEWLVTEAFAEAGREAGEADAAGPGADHDPGGGTVRGAGATGAGRPAAPRRTGADPVKALMHRHRDLCERAVDPLEIAAGLEAHGVTDRTAARFRHRDVFSLAEEMYARIPRDGETPTPPAPEAASRPRADWALLTLLPGALCTSTVIGLHLTHGQARATVAAAGVLAVALALRAALARGPLSPGSGTAATGTSSWTYWLIAYALLGDGLLRTALAGGPDGLPDGTTNAPWPLAAAPLLAVTWACAPAAWTTHLLTARVRRKLTASRGLEDFAASVRPLLLGTFALFLCTLTALLTLTAEALDEPAPYAQTTALGALLLLSRLLTIHRFTHAPVVVLMATATAQATALATVFAARLPGCDVLAVPVQTLTDTWGPGSVQTLTCGTGALILLLHATRTLTRASAHAPTEKQW
ncbi:membrane protein [Streptomyces sp. MMG1533]|uniref:hypothetical protein n=1 Tax=Streptomyces sp. MMG1533 TaxID=1415546 RepID=UPI0006B00254|nr:hypothetical protein [Streptomyces sp. MMG1533]KOU55191.1 membrane protein [Streptomyces sp. MMG1533]